MSELDHKEGWALKNWCFWTVVLEKTHESPLDSKEIKPVTPKGNQLWIFTGRTDIEAEAPIFWPPDVKSQPIGKHKWGFTITREEEIQAPQLSTQSPLASDPQPPSFIYMLQFPCFLSFPLIHFLWKPSLTLSGTLSFPCSKNISYTAFACLPDRLNQS